MFKLTNEEQGVQQINPESFSVGSEARRGLIVLVTACYSLAEAESVTICHL